MERSNYVGAPEFYHLNLLCAALTEAFGHCVYQVGSSMVKRDFRDVDIRAILEDEDFDRLFPDAASLQATALWNLMCASISDWLSQRSGLPVDFQIQKRSRVTLEDWDKPRNAVGLFINPRRIG